MLPRYKGKLVQIFSISIFTFAFHSMVAKVWQIFLGKLGCIPAETDAETQLFPEK